MDYCPEKETVLVLIVFVQSNFLINRFTIYNLSFYKRFQKNKILIYVK